MDDEVRITIAAGLDGAIDRVAALAREASAFLTRGWFAAAEPVDVSTILAVDGAGVPLIALPVVMVGLLRAVPGSYWPFRSFPVACQARVEHMAALLGDRAARRLLGAAWRIGPVYADDPALDLVRRAAPRTGWMVAERRIASSYMLDMAALAEEGEFPRKSTLRKNRFHEKHLAAEGALEWRFVRGRDWTPAIFDDLAAIEAASWHAGASDPKFLPGPHREFWEALARDSAQAEHMNAAILYIGGRPVAYSFDVDTPSLRYAIANSYDPAFAKHSPGRCLQYRNIVDALARGIARIDWGAGDAGYKTQMGARPAAEIVDCLVIRAGLRAPLARLVAALWRLSGRCGGRTSFSRG